MDKKVLPLNAPGNAKQLEYYSLLQQLAQAGGAFPPAPSPLPPAGLPVDSPVYPNTNLGYYADQGIRDLYNQAAPRSRQLTQYPQMPGRSPEEQLLLIKMLQEGGQQGSSPASAPPTSPTLGSPNTISPLSSHGPISLPAKKEPKLPPPSGGMPVTSAAISALSTGDAPEFTVPASSNSPLTQGNLSQFNSPDYTGQVMGGQELAQYLARPQSVDMSLPQISQWQSFGMTPGEIGNALNTNLAYKQAQQSAQQQDFANRITSLATAGGMDEREARKFSQKFIDYSNQVGLEKAVFDYNNAETPEQNRMRNAQVAAKLSEYKELLKAKAGISLSKLGSLTGDWSDRDKARVKWARDVLTSFQKSIPKYDFEEILKSGNTSALMEMLNAGTATIENPKDVELLPEAIAILNEYGVTKTADRLDPNARTSFDTSRPVSNGKQTGYFQPDGTIVNSKGEVIYK